jgi:hypothetical protein
MLHRGINEKERPMSESLSEAFARVVDAFNKNNSKALEKLLHPNAVLNRIRHRSDADSMRGRTAAIKHLTQNHGQTQFTPDDPPLVNTRTGTVSGTGRWEVKGGKTERISYSFIFTQDIKTKKWSLLNMEAIPQP